MAKAKVEEKAAINTYEAMFLLGSGHASDVDGALKLAVTAPPIEGRANEACIRFLAELLNVARSSVTIAAGASSRNKVVRIEGLTAERVRARLKIL